MRLTSLLVALAVAGCGDNAGNSDASLDQSQKISDAATPGDGSVPVDAASPPDLAKPPGNTGAPCASAAECGGMQPVCLTTQNGQTWPGGYCSSSCNPVQNDPGSGLNPACPGSGTCAGQGMMGSCFAPCGPPPCARMGYSCFATPFNACEPTSLSQCDPTVAGKCGAGMSCVRIGPDPVGRCDPGCDLFAENCPADGQGNPQACYASQDNGEGTCFSLRNPPGSSDGMQCMFLNDCAPGLYCHGEGAFAYCRPYCGGPNNVACTNGKACVDLSAKVPKSVVGLCGG
jgi:hypothetical protein